MSEVKVDQLVAGCSTALIVVSESMVARARLVAMALSLTCVASSVAVVVAWMTVPWIFAPCAGWVQPPRDIYNWVPDRVAFGSCMRQWEPAPVLQAVAARGAEVFIWLGDNVYVEGAGISMWWAYNRLSCHRDFRQLRHMVQLATWDDHDYGCDNCGVESTFKESARVEFLRFWRVPWGNERAKREENAIFHAHVFDNGTHVLRVVLLDLRMTRNSTSIMATAQWVWLEAELRQRCDVTVIASSTPVAVQARGGDTWAGSYPRDLARLAGLVAAVPQRVVFLSGDIHYGEVSHRNNFYDITSSGITHVQKVDPGDNNAFRINGTLVREPNAGELDVWAHEARLLGANGSVLAEVALADYWSVVL